VIEVDGNCTPFAVAETLHACINGATVEIDAGQPIEAEKAAGVGADGGLVTVTVALEEEVRLDDTVAT